MNVCSPVGSGTTIVHSPPGFDVFDRASGSDEGDQLLKLPASATLVASARINSNRTPDAVVAGGPDTTPELVAAHDALTTTANATAIDRSTRIASGD
jgi:hypothetical protein